MFKSLSQVQGLKEQKKSAAENYVNTPKIAIEKYQKDLKKYTLQTLSANKQKVDFFGRMIETMNPINTLKKGFTITMIDGKTIKSASEIGEGSLLTTKFWDGEVKSVVK